MVAILAAAVLLADIPAEDVQMYIEQSKAWRAHHYVMTHTGDWREKAKAEVKVETGVDKVKQNYHKKHGTKFPSTHPFNKRITDGTRVDLWRNSKTGEWFGTIRAEERYYYRGPNHNHWNKQEHSKEMKCDIYLCPATNHWYYYCKPDGAFYPVDYCPYGTYNLENSDIMPDGSLKVNN